MTKGTYGRPTTGRPYVPVIDLSPISGFALEFEKHLGDFDEHIACSIPSYGELRVILGRALVEAFRSGATMLDIGASEGSLVKAISSYSAGTIITVALDPNRSMVESFRTISSVPGSTCCRAAFGTKEQAGDVWGRDDEDGVAVFYYTNVGGAFDIVHEGMTFQFMSENRSGYVSYAKDLLLPNGVFISEEKLFCDSWVENEEKKDQYKLRYFAPRDVLEKKHGVLESMMWPVFVDEYEAVLRNNFDVVVQYWDSGNFKGYIASDSAAVVARVLDNMMPTHSEYSTVKTPRSVCIPSEDLASPRG